MRTEWRLESGLSNRKAGDGLPSKDEEGEESKMTPSFWPEQLNWLAKPFTKIAEVTHLGKKTIPNLLRYAKCYLSFLSPAKSPHSL